MSIKLEYKLHPGEEIKYHIEGVDAQEIIRDGDSLNRSSIENESDFKIKVVDTKNGTYHIRIEMIPLNKAQGESEPKESDSVIIFNRRGAFDIDGIISPGKFNDLDVYYGSVLLTGLILPEQSIEPGYEYEYYDSQGNRNILKIDATQDYLGENCAKIDVQTFTEEGLEYPIENLGELSTEAKYSILFSIDKGRPLYIEGENITYIEYITGEHNVIQSVYKMEIQR